MILWFTLATQVLRLRWAQNLGWLKRTFWVLRFRFVCPPGQSGQCLSSMSTAGRTIAKYNSDCVLWLVLAAGGTYPRNLKLSTFALASPGIYSIPQGQSSNLDSVWAQSRHPGGLKIWFLVEFVRNFEAQLSRPSGISNSMIFNDFGEKFHKNDLFDETFGFWGLFDELEPHTRGGKYPPTHFASFQALKRPKRARKKIV